MSIPKRKFKVIEGGREPINKWLDFPPTVVARSPYNQQEPVIYRVATEAVRKAAKVGRRQIVFDLWSMVFGLAPPINNIESYNKSAQKGLSVLADAHACFRGIKRPLAEDNNGDNMLAYVIRPRFFYKSQQSMACLAKKAKVPSDVVFVIYVRLDEPCIEGPPAVKGVVTHWQFVEADVVKTRGQSGDELEWLPINHKNRYQERLW